MFMSILAIAIAGGIGYLWLIRGFFSALLHLICVVAAGAVAFAAWEPISMAILKGSPTKGFASFLGGMAFGVGLIVPFALSLFVFRVVLDKALPANAQAEKIWDVIGGGICGLASGTITAGIVVMGVGMLWLPQDFWGSQRLRWDNSNGSLVSDKKLIFPADDIVAGLYGKLSLTTFAVGNESALGRQYPSLADVPSSVRRSMQAGRGRNFLRPADITLQQVFTVGADENWRAFEGYNVQSGLRQRDFQVNQPLVDRTGETLIKPGAYITGFVVQFKEAARERKSGQVNMTPAQARLVCINDDGETVEVFPAAMISRADASEVRWVRFPMTDEDGLGTVAGDGTPLMAFEFVVPAGRRPLSLFIKNVRIDVSSRRPDQRFATSGSRQAAIDNGSLMRAGRIEINEDRAITVALGEDLRARGITEGNTVRGIVLQDGTTGGLHVNKERQIDDGIQRFKPQDMHRNTLDKALRVDKFAVSEGTDLVQIAVTPGREGITPAVDIGAPPISETSRDLPVYLIDDQGNLYSCIGYAYEDQNVGEIRYTRDAPLSGLSQLPKLPSRTQRGQNITLLFEVTRQVNIIGFVVGNELMVRFQPAVSFRE